MNFLPVDYQAPKPASQFWFRLEEGENRVRILSRPVFGWEDWTPEKKPLRYKMNEKPAKPIDPKKGIKHFWAFIVWNVNAEQIQIMHITQATIRTSIEALNKDSDWGSPFGYDIKIFKKGQGIETEYSVNPAPHKPVSEDVLKAFNERPINLEALFINADPFSLEWNTYTPLMTEAEETKVTSINQIDFDVNPLYIDYDQFAELTELKEGCSEASQKGFEDYLLKGYGIQNLAKLPLKEFANIKNKLTIRFQENQKQLLKKEVNEVKDKKK